MSAQVRSSPVEQPKGVVKNPKTMVDSGRRADSDEASALAVRVPRDKKAEIDVEALNVIDLRALPSTRTRIKGSGYVISDRGRRAFGGLEYLLVREPKNKVDPKAVAIYGKGRRVGYISTSKAATFAPILDALGADAYAVTGTGASPTSIVLWVDLPTVPALRLFAK